MLCELLDEGGDGNVGALFDFNADRIQDALTFVKTGKIIPRALSVLARLQLKPATPAARKRMLRLPGEDVSNEFQLLQEVVHQELMLRPVEDTHRAALWKACQAQPLLLLWPREREKYGHHKHADAWWKVRQALIMKDTSLAVATYRAQSCAERGALASLRLWVQWGGVDPSIHDNHAFWRAALNGHLKVVQYLCALPPACGVDPGARDNVALRWAAIRGHLPMVQYLCTLDSTRGVNPSANDNNALQRSAANGHLDVVRYLCALDPSRGVDPSAGNNLALQLAVKYGHLDVVEFLYAPDPVRGVDNMLLRLAEECGQQNIARFFRASASQAT